MKISIQLNIKFQIYSLSWYVSIPLQAITMDFNVIPDLIYCESQQLGNSTSLGVNKSLDLILEWYSWMIQVSVDIIATL